MKRVLPSRQTIVCIGCFGRSTFSERPCLKKKSSSAVSLSPTTVSPFGPTPIFVIARPVSPDFSKRSASAGLLKT